MKISVCMATYNGEKYIKEQLESILCQLGENDEIIISDDGSTDNTKSIIESFKDKRIKFFTNNGVKGVVSNFENSLNKSSGDYIFLADQDDVWLSNKVTTCLNRLKDFDLIVCNCKVVDGSLNVLHQSYFNLARSGRGFFKNIYRSTYLGCCLAFRRDILTDILPFPKKLMMFHDWWIGFIAELKLNVYFENEPLMLYRRHINTTSNTVGSSSNSLFFKIYSRVQIFVLGVFRVFIR